MFRSSHESFVWEKELRCSCADENRRRCCHAFEVFTYSTYSCFVTMFSLIAVMAEEAINQSLVATAVVTFMLEFFSSPPPAVQTVLTAVAIMLGHQEPTWSEVRRVSVRVLIGCSDDCGFPQWVASPLYGFVQQLGLPRAPCLCARSVEARRGPDRLD